MLALCGQDPGGFVSAGSIFIASRFNGPPDSANGGYACGLIAVATDASVSVRLHRPPPLEVPLLVEPTGPGRWQVRDQAEVVATATETEVRLELPVPPDYLQALDLSKHYVGFEAHSFPTCFVCGPRRRAGDGLRIFPGAVASGRGVAAPWLPHPSLGDAAGKVRPEFVWAALDCPGAFAVMTGNRTLVLGEFAVHIDRLPPVEKPCVVMGWPMESAGRKHRAGTALFDEDGSPVARGIATWIELASGA
jgi:hypothetical protein